MTPVTCHTDGMAEFLFEQLHNIFCGELAEEIVQAFCERCGRETGSRRAGFQREFSEAVVRLQPAFGNFGEDLREMVRGALREIAFAVALQRLARLGNHRR